MRSGAGEVEEILIVVNPASSGGRTGRRWEAMAGRLREAGLDFEAALTTRPGEAIEIARTGVASGRRIVVAAGGDGTLNEVVNGFASETGDWRPGSTALAMLPLGTGGDFRRTFGLPGEAAAVAAVLKDGRRRRLDVGRLRYRGHSGSTETRYFINIASVGIGGEVVHRVNSGFRLVNGAVTFLLASVVSGLAYHNRPMRIVLDGTQTLELTAQQVVVANCKYFGGGMMVAPEAVPDDGLFDVVVAGDLNTLEGARFLAQVRRGTHVGGSGGKVTSHRARQVEISADSQVRIDLDGEQPGFLPACFEVLPAALDLVLPAVVS